MQMARVLQGAILLAAIAGGLYLVNRSADGWADWVVFGVFVATAVGAGMAVHHRRYTVKRRDFVTRYDDKRR